MTAKDIDRILDELSSLRGDVAEVKSDTRVMSEKLEHVPSWTDIKEEITQRIDIAQAKCSIIKKIKPPMSWGTVAKISAILTAGLTPVAIAVASVIQSAPAQ